MNQRDAENVSLLHWAAINNRLEIAGQVIITMFFTSVRTALEMSTFILVGAEEYQAHRCAETDVQQALLQA